MKRRKFFQKISTGAVIMTMGQFPMTAFTSPEILKITILHTNDFHSRIDPFPMDGGRFQGMGGIAKRAALIKQIRKAEKYTLLLDAGDIFQGTPYFNFYSGELEFKLMSEMKYDAATIGNHDFDAGIEGLHRQLPNAKFPFVISNYDFQNTILNGKTKNYQIFNKGFLKIGVFGLGIKLRGLVPAHQYKETQYLDPIKKGQEVTNILKYDENCDYIICLSHLGHRYRRNQVSDVDLAQNTQDIDLILGGHTHTFLERPEKIKNKAGKITLINQAGWGGIVLGRLDIHFERNKKRRCVSCSSQVIR